MPRRPPDYSREAYWAQQKKRTPVLIVAVSVALAVGASVSVAALGNGNNIVKVIDAVDDHGAMSVVSVATMRSSKSTPLSYNSLSTSSSSFMTSSCVLVYGR
jgi:hypothetical protein